MIVVGKRSVVNLILGPLFFAAYISAEAQQAKKIARIGFV